MSRTRWMGTWLVHRRGQALVEFALSIVVLSLLLMGVIEFGLAFYTYIVVVDAADEAAAYASLYPYERDTSPSCTPPCRLDNDDDIVARIDDTSRGNAAMDPALFTTVEIAPDYLHRDPCTVVTVRTVYHHALLMPLFFGTHVDLNYTATKMIVPEGSLGICPYED